MWKVSVIITCYNGQKFIKDTLESILNQSGANELFRLEVIAVDDCSTDNTWDILGQYNIKRYKNSSNSGGPNLGRNLGIGKSSGNYICISDQDDIWKKDRIRTIVQYFGKAPIISSGYTVKDLVRDKTIVRKKEIQDPYIQYPKNVTFRAKVMRSSKMQNTYLGSIFYTKELKSILFEEKYGMSDFDWVLRLFHDQDSLELTESLYTRIVDGGNLSLNENYRIKDFECSIEILNQFEKQYPKEVRIGRKRLHGSLARYFYLVNEMAKSRNYLLKSEFNLKTIGYYLTSFWGANYIREKFEVFG